MSMQGGLPDVAAAAAAQPTAGRAGPAIAAAEEAFDGRHDTGRHYEDQLLPSGCDKLSSRVLASSPPA
jgi:hypothetical protein